MNEHKIRKTLVRLIKKYTLHWYAVTAVLYFLAIPFTIFVYPATTLMLTAIVLFGGFTSSMAALATTLVEQHDDEVD